MSEKRRKRTKLSRDWNEKHLDRISVTVPRGLKSLIQAHAKKNGQTVNGLISRLLQAELGLSEEQWKEEKRSD